MCVFNKQTTEHATENATGNADFAFKIWSNVTPEREEFRLEYLSDDSHAFRSADMQRID